MRKLLLVTIVLLGFGTINAQEKVKEGIKKGADAVETEAVKLYKQAKTGGFKIGANIGLPIQGASDVSSFNFGADIAYLFEVMENLEVGALIGYTHFVGDGEYVRYGNYFKKNTSKVVATGHSNGFRNINVSYSDESFIPIAVTGRWYFNNRKMYAGVDLGYAIHVSGDADGGVFFRPKFGYNLGKINLVGSLQTIGGGVNFKNADAYSVKGFSSANFGVEFAF